MASEIRVNTINNRSGLGTITISDSGAVFAGVTTITNLQVTGSTTGVASTDNIRTNTNATFLQNVNISGVTTVSAGSASAPSITATGDLDTGIFFPAADTIGFAEGGSEAARIDSSGRLLVGTTTVSSDSTAVLVGRSDGATSAPNLRLEANFTPADGNSLGALLISQTGQTGQNASARIEARRDGGTWTSGTSMPGRLVFSTTADGASSPTERMRIDNAGDILVSRTGAGNGSNTDVITLDNDNSNTNDNLKTSIAFKRTGNNSSYVYSRISSERVGTHDTDIVFATNYGGSLSEELRIKANGGITFNGDTAATNALDDYEEGSWTPAMTFGGGNTGLTGSFTGVYTKVGRIVTATFQITLTNKGSSTGTLAITGLPFTIAANYQNVSGFSYIHRLAMGQTGGQIFIGATGTTLWIRRAGYSGADAVLLDNGDFSTTCALWGGITYHA